MKNALNNEILTIWCTSETALFGDFLYFGLWILTSYVSLFLCNESVEKVTIFVSLIFDFFFFNLIVRHAIHSFTAIFWKPLKKAWLKCTTETGHFYHSTLNCSQVLGRDHKSIEKAPKFCSLWIDLWIWVTCKISSVSKIFGFSFYTLHSQIRYSEIWQTPWHGMNNKFN